MDTSELFGKEKISKVLLKLAPPVMLAQLIQALYNIVDSLFVGNYSQSGLTALSIIYPIQLLMIALAVGSGVGINTVRAAGSAPESAARRTNTPGWELRWQSPSGWCLRQYAGLSCRHTRECPRQLRRS